MGLVRSRPACKVVRLQPVELRVAEATNTVVHHFETLLLGTELTALAYIESRMLPIVSPSG